jgi:hypothetical protein
MADGVDLAAVLHHPHVGAGEQREHLLHRDLVLEDLLALAEDPSVGRFVLQDRGAADVLDLAAGEGAIGAVGRAGGIGLHELEADRRAPAIEDQDVH